MVVCLFSVCGALLFAASTCGLFLLRGSRLAPPTPLLSIAPLRDRWFAVGALAPRRRNSLQCGLLSLRTGISVWSLGYFATASRQWSPTPLCGLRHGVIRWVVGHRWAVTDPRVPVVWFL